jgi:phosphoribosylanthranilate isomerase
MFQVKICGITNVPDAQYVVQAGADAVGLNFYPASPRFVTDSAARQICDALSPQIVRVGVFVNTAAREICGTFEKLNLNLIQLHGDEPPDFIAKLGNRPVIRAFRLQQHGLAPVLDYLRACQLLGVSPKLVLLDAPAKGIYGGSGKVSDWSLCAQYPSSEGFPPLVMAGGLTHVNVAQAIAQVRPSAVDTASGVESSPGRKDHAAVTAFVEAARKAFAANSL